MGLVVFFWGMVGLIGVLCVRRQTTKPARAKLRPAPSTFEDNALVTFSGTVKQLGEPLIAPLSGKPCVAYRVGVRTYLQPATGSTKLANALRQQSRIGSRLKYLDRHAVHVEMMPFTLVTKSGEILIDSRTCELLLQPEPIIPRKLDREQRLLERLEIGVRAADAGFDEARVEAGAKIAVQGIARLEVVEHGGETGFREAPTQIRLTGDDAHPLTIDRA